MSVPNWIERRASGRNAAIAFVCILIMNALVMPWAQAQLEALSGGVGPLDLAIFSTPETLRAMVQAYGDEGRSFYARSILTADTLYPLVYGLGLALIIAHLMARITARSSRWRSAIFIPLVCILVDLCENAMFLIMVHAHPEAPLWAGEVARVLTVIKFALVASASLIALIAGVMALVAWRRRIATAPRR